ncbi:flippase-like domain-containing protein [candidate division TA06 bacterium]|nr:flippase-like domain-containing protein [candidate division TA06 bacterium]
MAIITPEKVKRGLRIFLLITILTLLVLFFFTVRKETLRQETWEGLKQIKTTFLLLALFITLLRLYGETLRIQVLAWAGGKWISLKDSLDLNLGSLFLGAVTPFQSGGIPLQLYILNKSGLSIGRGTNVILLKGLLPSLLFLISLPFIIFYFGDLELFDSPLIRNLARYIFSLYLLLIFLLFYLLLNPPWFKKGLLRLEGFLRRRGIVKGEWGLKLLEKGFLQLEEFKKGLKESIGIGRMKLLLAFLLSIIGLALHLITAPVLLLGLGLNPPFLTTMVLQMLLYFLLLFVPTPGASGIAELGGFALFSLVCPDHLLLPFIFLWRFFYLYLAAAIGGGLLLQRVKRSGIQMNASTEKKDPPFSISSHSRNSEGQ